MSKQAHIRFPGVTRAATGVLVGVLAICAGLAQPSSASAEFGDSDPVSDPDPNLPSYPIADIEGDLVVCDQDAVEVIFSRGYTYVLLDEIHHRLGAHSALVLGHDAVLDTTLLFTSDFPSITIFQGTSLYDAFIVSSGTANFTLDNQLVATWVFEESDEKLNPNPEGPTKAKITVATGDVCPTPMIPLN